MRFLVICLSVLFISSAYSQEKKRKIIYKYKKYEKFDMDDIQITGDVNGPGDLSINPRLRKKFSNKLPDKPHFNDEMVKNIDLLQ